MIKIVVVNLHIIEIVQLLDYYLWIFDIFMRRNKDVFVFKAFDISINHIVIYEISDKINKSTNLKSLPIYKA